MNCERRVIIMIIYNLYPNGKPKALTMSYDDGRIHDVRLAEIFDKYGIKGTFHLNSNFFGRDNYITAKQIPEIFKNHEASAHTCTHPSLITIPKERIITEVINDRRQLEDITGYPVRGMSYPYGTYNDDVVDILKQIGIEYSRTTIATNNFNLPSDYLRWHPTCHHKGDILNKLESFKTLTRGNLPMFYVWGHSYEFANDNNWELIETFCCNVSQMNDVWFATNIEIVDYLNAVRNLKVSVNEKTVYNPSAISVWVTANGSPTEIKPGLNCIN